MKNHTISQIKEEFFDLIDQAVREAWTSRTVAGRIVFVPYYLVITPIFIIAWALLSIDELTKKP